MAQPVIPSHLWTEDTPAPKVSDVVTLLAHFLDQLADYPKTFKAIIKEAKTNGIDLDIAEWERGIETGSAVNFMDLWSAWYDEKSAHPTLPASSEEEDSDSEEDSDDSDDSDEEMDEDEAVEAVVDVEAEESSDDGSEADVPDASLKRKRASDESSDESSDDSSSDDDSDSSSDESEAPPTKKSKTVEKAAAEPIAVSSDSDSDSSSSDSSDSDSSSDDSSDDDDDDSDTKPATAAEPETSATSDSSSSDESPTPTQPTKKGKKTKSAKAQETEDSGRSQASSATLEAEPEPSHIHPSRLAQVPAPDVSASGQKAAATPGSGKKGPVVPFSRIPKDQYVDPRFASNEYQSYDYADRAHRDLIVTKGKGFTKEKNKKKRGSYRGGAIDLTPKGIKFDD
jgi:hypothetical protein